MTQALIETSEYEGINLDCRYKFRYCFRSSTTRICYVYYNKA